MKNKNDLRSAASVPAAPSTDKKEQQGILTNPVGLSGRLSVIVRLAGTGDCVCDVGCDHAHVPIRLLQEGRFSRAVGMDVIAGPLEKAAGNLALYGMQDRVELRLSDGLDAYETGEADTLIVTGMGGTLMEEILLRDETKTKSFRALVLGPQSDPDKVRAALRFLGFRISEECLVYEDGKYYPVVRAVDPAETDTDPQEAAPAFAPGITEEIRRQAEDLFGPVLLRRRDPVLREYLTRQTAVLEKILLSVTQGAQARDSGDMSPRDAALLERHLQRRQEILRDLEVFRAALTVYR